jgi:hypothetical protein
MNIVTLPPSVARTKYHNISCCLDLSPDTNQFLLTGNDRGMVSIYNMWEQPPLRPTQQHWNATSSAIRKVVYDLFKKRP